MIFLGEVKIGDERGSGTFEAGNFKSIRDKTCEAESGVFRGVFLGVGRFVRLVDDN